MSSAQFGATRRSGIGAVRKSETKTVKGNRTITVTRGRDQSDASFQADVARAQRHANQ